MRPVFYERRLKPNFGISGRLFRRILLLAIGALVIWGCYSFVAGIVRGIRGDRHAGEAARLLAEGNRVDARGELRLALALSPRHVGAARMLAAMLDSEDNPLSLDYHRIVVEAGEATEDDQRSGLEAALRHGDHALAIEWAGLVASGFDDPALPVLTNARIRWQLGDHEGAGAEFRRALAVDENPATLGALADYLIADKENGGGGNPEEGLDLMVRLGESPGREGVDALKRALREGLVKARRVPDFLRALRGHPAAGVGDWIFADVFEIGMDPGQAERVAGEAAARLRGLAVGERLEGLLWLSGRGFPEAVLEALPREDAVSSVDAFTIRFDALVEAGRLAEADRLLRDPANPLPPASTLARMGWLFERNGDSTGAEGLHQRALEAAGDDPVRLLEEYARLGEEDRFRASSGIVFNDPSAASRILRRLLDAARLGRSSKMELAILEAASAYPWFRGDASLTARIVTARLFCGKSIDLQPLEAFHGDGGDLDMQIALAAGRLAAGRKAGALYGLEQAGVDSSLDGIGDRELLVLVAVLAANGRDAEAESAAMLIEPANLTREEQEFLRRSVGGVPRI